MAHESVHASIQGMLKTLSEEIKAIEARIRQHIDDDPTLRPQKK